MRWLSNITFFQSFSITINLSVVLDEDKKILERMYPSEILPKVYPKEVAEPTDGSFDDIDEILNSNIFSVMLNRRSQRKFEDKEIEDWKTEIIYAAADTAPTAGG